MTLARHINTFILPVVKRTNPTAIIPRIAGTVIPALLLLAAGCGQHSDTVTQTVFSRSTPVSVSIPHNTPEIEQHIIISTASNLIKRIYFQLSLNIEESETTSINRIAHSIRLPISRDTYNLLQLCQQFTRLTDGAFDITITPIAFLWGFHGGETPKKPLSRDILNAALRGVGPENINLVPNAIELASPYTRIDFGSIIEAYAIDLSIIKLRRMEYHDLCMFSDDMMRGLGSENSSVPWTYPVRDPFTKQTTAFLLLKELPAASTVQTGDHTVSIAGTEYSHIIDPRTGQPAQKYASVTVLAPTTTKATALARALFVMDIDEGRTILEEHFPRCEVLYIPATEPAQYIMTQGMADLFVSEQQTNLNIRILGN